MSKVDPYCVSSFFFLRSCNSCQCCSRPESVGVTPSVGSGCEWPSMYRQATSNTSVTLGDDLAELLGVDLAQLGHADVRLVALGDALQAARSR